MKTKKSFSEIQVQALDALIIIFAVIFMGYIFMVCLSIYNASKKPFTGLVKQGYNPEKSNLPPATISFYDSTMPPYRVAFVHEDQFLPPAYFYAAPKAEQSPYFVLGEPGSHIVMDYCARSGIFIGNISLVSVMGRNFICTAIHCVENMGIPYIAVGPDVALVPDTVLIRQMERYTKPLKANLIKNERDSIFIIGYYLGMDEGYVTPVRIGGIGEECSLKPLTSEKAKHVWGNSVFIKMENYYDLHGVSGSPALNRDGEIVGVASTQHLYYVNGDLVFYIRISLFGM